MKGRAKVAREKSGEEENYITVEHFHLFEPIEISIGVQLNEL